MLAFFLAICLAIAQLPGIAIRYLPFANFVTAVEKQRLFKFYLVWFISKIIILTYVFQIFGSKFLIYKLMLIICAFPYFFINLAIIKNRTAQHLFILGMQGIYSFLLHTLATMVIVVLTTYHNYSPYWLLTLQTIFYLILFALSFIPLRKILKNIFVAYHSVNDNFYWQTIYPLPLLLCLNNMFLALHESRVDSWFQLISRFSFGLSFFVICRCIHVDLKTLEKRFELAHNNKLLGVQITSLKEQFNLVEETEKKLNIMRHDMRHQLQLLNTLIREQDLTSALLLIDGLNQELEETRIVQFCKNTLVNTALSVYISRAQGYAIQVEHKINIPAKLPIAENDFSIILSNLLENAINATKQQALENRWLKIIAQADATQLAVIIENYYAGEVLFDTDGFPKTLVKGHGIGIHSLKAFLNKYQGQAIFTHQDNYFKVLLIFNFPNTNQNFS